MAMVEVPLGMMMFGAFIIGLMIGIGITYLSMETWRK